MNPLATAAKVEPVYPSVAKRARIEGKVILRMLIVPSGDVVVTGLCTASNPMFINAAAEAVSQWIYEPGRLGDLAVSTDYVIRVDFRFHSLAHE